MSAFEIESSPLFNDEDWRLLRSDMGVLDIERNWSPVKSVIRNVYPCADSVNNYGLLDINHWTEWLDEGSSRNASPAVRMPPATSPQETICTNTPALVDLTVSPVRGNTPTPAPTPSVDLTVSPIQRRICLNRRTALLKRQAALKKQLAHIENELKKCDSLKEL